MKVIMLLSQSAIPATSKAPMRAIQLQVMNMTGLNAMVHKFFRGIDYSQCFLHSRYEPALEFSMTLWSLPTHCFGPTFRLAVTASFIYFFQKVLSSFSLDLFDTRIRLLPASEWLTMWDIEIAALKSSGNPNSFLVETARISLVMA